MKPMQNLRRMFALGADPRHQNSSPTECENLYNAGASVLNAMVTMLKNDSSSDRRKGDLVPTKAILAETLKLLQNSAYDKSLENLESRRDVVYATGENTKLSKDDYQLCEMDTDLLYMALSIESLEEAARLHLLQALYQEYPKWFPAKACDTHNKQFILSTLALVDLHTRNNAILLVDYFILCVRLCKYVCSLLDDWNAVAALLDGSIGTCANCLINRAKFCVHG
ncbi:hypothetical protein EGW08_017570 [Elysia chlorotica]|uniref:Uncharacterized protein n=1 Tax=Elysia chlorotica TaxID=188477 RepID=A0A433SZD2_ELYCH|nr:hypothetical protein EGW08_017570 [Elysia chlorotica]